MSSDWRQWTYTEWNERLLEYCLNSGAPATEPVERIPATPEELLRVSGDAQADPTEVAAVFVACCKAQIPNYKLSFCSFCSNYGKWTPKSPSPPHYFAMLWLTCFIAYGYPDDTGGFHDRVKKVFGRGQHLGCLRNLWRDLSQWSNERAGRSSSHLHLRLPPPDDYRSDIGASWFLAFPHQHDRHKLRNLLLAADLVGEEPPIAPVVDVLRRSEAIFSQAFCEDFAHFLERFSAHGGDARKSAFWRAVRQEALSPDPEEREADRAEVALLGYFDDDEFFVVYLACATGADLPAGFSCAPLSIEIDGMSHYVLYQEGAAPGRSAMESATLEVLEGRVTVPKASHYIRRGVLAFQETLGREYRLVSGAQANEANVAFVREELREAFIRAYGGVSSPSRFHGWHEVVNCKITVRRELPQGLHGVFHLQETMVPLPVRLVGGIRTTEGFLDFPGFLPRVRFDGASAVEVIDSEGQLTGRARLDPDTSDWLLPNQIAGSAPSRWIVRVHWVSEAGVERVSEDELVLASSQVRYDYKRLTSGAYYVEGCSPPEIEVIGDADVPLGVTAEHLEREEPDLLDLLPEARYLGPGLGEFSRTATPGFDWLVVGPRNSPESLIFTGDPAAPTPPAQRRSGARGDWRHWRKAMRNPPRNRRAFARLPGGRLIPLGELPEIERVLKEYQKHDPIEEGPVGEEVSFDVSESPRWYGVVPDPRITHFIDALAALCMRRGGIRYAVLLDLLSGLLGLEFRANKTLFFDLVRALVEAGILDIAHAQGRGATYAIARRPTFVAHRVGDRLRASLIGLTPALLTEHVRRAVRAHGGRWEEICPPCRWLPSILRIECSDTTVLRAISRDLDLDEPRWLRWPLFGPGGLDIRPDAQALRDGAPHWSFATEARWDWNTAKFISVQSDQAPESGVVIEKRIHRERCAAYVVLLDGEPWGWTFIRNWALLHAYTFKHGCAPFEAGPSAPIGRSSNIGVYLPLPLGRLCALLGDGLSGPLVGPDGVSVAAYRYPIVHTFRERLGDFLPARCETDPKMKS